MSKSKRKEITQVYIRFSLRIFLIIFGIAAYIAKLSLLLNIKKRGKEGTILLTATFYSENWILSHLKPIAKSRFCSRLLMVSSSPLPEVEKVEAIYPPKWLVKTIGEVPARLLVFAWTALRVRPQIVGGFHLLLNGLLAILLAKILRCKSLYICGGGPREVIGGGYRTENRLFGKLIKPDLFIEKRLIRAVKLFDLIITMGSSAVDFFKSKGVKSKIYIVPGGFDSSRYSPGKTTPEFDLIWVGRLSSIKRVDLFIYSVQKISQQIEELEAVIVGDGPLLGVCKELVLKLGIEKTIRFVGHQRQVEKWLQKSKVFVLTSDSEGLSLAMIEAMLCGLVPVVSHVGDLGDLVESGRNGYLVAERTAEAFAEKIKSLLLHPNLLIEFGKLARESAIKYSIDNSAKLWDDILKTQANYDTENAAV